MKLNKCVIGQFFELFNQACNSPNLSPYEVSGVNSDKEFFEPSRQVGLDTSKYKLVPNGYFACNLMHVGRDWVLPIALNHSGKNKIVSPAYTVFRIKKNDVLLTEYFFLFLKSSERDRYFWFHTDASVRDGMSWNDFCTLEVVLPDISIQQKYVDIYNAMLANQNSYERGLEDLKLSVDALLDQYKAVSPRRVVGDLVDEIDVRNSDGTLASAQGINITKQFMPSVASSDDLRKYKIVFKGQFAYSAMQTGRDECIRIALQNEDNPIVVSPAYSVLQVKDPAVLAEYIMMWFSRKESDRLGWFMSDASVRASLDLNRFYEIEIPVPDINVQQYIVNIYLVYQLRKEINEQLKSQIRDLCPILIKGSIEEASA